MSKRTREERIRARMRTLRPGQVTFSHCPAGQAPERFVAGDFTLHRATATRGRGGATTALGKLIQAGELKTTDTLGALLPDYPNADAKPTTLDQLLHFQVGIADFFGERFAQTPKDRFQSNHDYYLFVAPQPLTFKPGEKTEYCNGCFVVLGEIIARVTGVPYERYIQEHVFAPAAMTTAGFLAFGDPHVALGYTRKSQGQLWTSAVTMHGHHGSAAGGEEEVTDRSRWRPRQC